ncbi:MAG: helix-turn-helix transcriptional regulator [Clostridia bacterium]|nr:helix-turn-helix transcriptional regulator [Clostridia bacterium]MBQ9976849.1 helix-turn-helix transcriptional regulator [Clostridia bacterium]
MKKYQNRLRDLRQDKDLTQEEIAKVFFLQTTQYRRYENGETDLPLEWAKKFAVYYNVSIDYIAGLTDTPKSYK